MNMTAPHHSLINSLRQLANRFDIPDNAKRIALNLRVTNYYQTRTGFHPVEIQLERDLRDSKQSEWSVVFIASFAYPDEQAKTVDVELYFNFLRCWFYQPDIDKCELHQPKVRELYQAYERALMKQLKQRSFDEIQATLVSIHNGNFEAS